MEGLDQMFESINVQNDTLPFPAMGYYSPLDVYEEMICNSLDIKTPRKNDLTIQIAPNPAQNYLSINSQSELTLLKIYNSLGTIIQKSVIPNFKTLKIDISDLSPSIYFIKLYSKDVSSTLKFIKN